MEAPRPADLHGFCGTFSPVSIDGIARHKAADIARGAGIPPVFATHVLALLAHHDLLRARAGQNGGYTLALPPGQVTLLDVIEAAEGPIVSSECVLRDTRCGDAGFCQLHEAWSAAQQALRAVLAATTLADIVGGITKSLAETRRADLASRPGAQARRSVSAPPVHVGGKAGGRSASQHAVTLVLAGAGRGEPDQQVQ
jgi:Rrf2 family protein